MNDDHHFTIVVIESDEEIKGESNGWMLIEEEEGGFYFGTGFVNDKGTSKNFVSDRKDDTNLASAIRSAQVWACENGLQRMYLRLLG